MTMKERLNLMDEIKRKNDAAFAEMARIQRESKSHMWKAVKDMLRELLTLVAPVAIGMLAGYLVVWHV